MGSEENVDFRYINGKKHGDISSKEVGIFVYEKLTISF